jgi:DNA polymerase-3 subunit epsilon
MSWLSSLFARKVRREVVLSPEQRDALEAWQQLPAADLHSPHNRGRYVVVDVESSGLNMKKDRLISIGAVALTDSQMDFNDAFQAVLRQDQVSTHENILIHGIGGSAQSEGVEPVEALLAFLRYIGNAPLVAYHAFFDQSMIDKAMDEYLGVKPDQVWIDLAWILPDFFQFRMDGRVALDDWLQHFEIENILRHNAVSDAYATAKLLQIAIAHGIHKGADSPASFIKIEKARRWMQQSR